MSMANPFNRDKDPDFLNDYLELEVKIQKQQKLLKKYEEFFKELKHIAKSKNYTGLEKGWAIEELFDEWEKENAE